MSTIGAKKRISALDEDDLLLEDVTPVKKARSDGDNTFDDEELDEDALLGLSDNEEQYEVDGVSDYQENTFSTEPELDEDGGYTIYPEGQDLGKHDFGEPHQFDHEESGQDFTLEDGIADEEYSEEATEPYEEEGFEHTGGMEETESEEYKEEPVVATTGDSSFLDVLDIDITDDSLIKELEEEEEIVKRSPRSTFAKPSEPPRKFSTPKVTPQTTPLKSSARGALTQRKEEQSRTTPQKTEVAEVEPIKSKETTTEEDEEEEDEEEKETRGDRFKSERKEIVSLKSGSRNRNIPDTLELSEASKKELEEYERQEQEEKQKRMQRRQGRRGGRGGRGWGRGGPGGPGGHFQRGRGFMNRRGRMPLLGPPVFGNRPMYFQRNPMRGFQEPQRFNPPPLIPIIPLQVQQPLITLTDASFTEDEMVQSFDSDNSHRNSPLPHHHAPPPPMVSQQRPQSRPPESRSPGKPVIHVNPHFKGQRPQLPDQTSHHGNSVRSVGQVTPHAPHTTVQAIPSVHEPYRRGEGGWHEQPQSNPVTSQGHHLQSRRMEELPPPGSSNHSWRETPPNEPVYAQSRIGEPNLQSEMHGGPTSSAPSNQHFQHHPEAPRDDAHRHLGPSNKTHPSNYGSDHHQDFGQNHHHKHHHEPHPHNPHHHHHPHDHHHPQGQDTTHPTQESFVASRVVHPQPSENFRGPQRQHRMETPHRQDQSNQADQWQSNQGARPQRPGPVRMPPPRPQGQQQHQQPGRERLAPPPQAMIEEASTHHQTEETTVKPEGMDSSEENDPETKKLRMQIEEQKKLREAIVKRKEERRQQLAAKRQMELKNRIATQKQNQENQSEQQPSQQNVNIQQQNQQQNMNKQQQRQQPQGMMNKQQLQQQGMNKQLPLQKRQQIMQKQPSQSHQSFQQGSNPGAKVMGQRGNPMQQRRKSAGQAVQRVQGTPQGQGFSMEQHHEVTAGHPIPTLGGGGVGGEGPPTGPAQSFQAGNRRPFHKGGGPQNISNVGRGQPQQVPIQHDHYQRGRGGVRGPLRDQSRGQVRGRGRGAMVQQQQRQVVSRQPSNFESAEHHDVQQHPQFPQPQGPHGSGHTPPQRQHHPPHQQQPQHSNQQQYHQQQQRGRGQVGKVSVKQRLGRGAGGVQQVPRGFQPQQQQRGGMQLKRGRGHGNFQGGRNPNAPQNLRHPHPGGGDAPLLNPQCGISIEGLDHGTDGNLVMRMMVAVGPVQALKMYPMHRKAIGFFVNPNHALTFQQMFNGSVVGFSQVRVKLLGGRPVT